MRFEAALASPGFGAVAEFKRRSPSAGDLRPDGDVAAVARAYESAGARAMSVLVDERFGGSLADLGAARAATSLPLLAKGFFSSRDDLVAVREAGADAALLILRDLDGHRRRRAARRRDARSASTRWSRRTTPSSSAGDRARRADRSGSTRATSPRSASTGVPNCGSSPTRRATGS